MQKNTNACLSAKHAPRCVGIILDGNRRWAQERGLPTLEGHRRGSDNLVRVTRHVQSRGIEHLVVYAFSTENWGRSTDEVSYLMHLFREMLTKKVDELKKENMRVRVVGQRERFDKDMRQMIEKAEKDTSENTGLTIWICLSYGGRAEIVAAALSVSAGEEEITEEAIANNLWTTGMPDPDIIIRTGGEKRLSGFLTWASVYSELFFVDTYWPTFAQEEFDVILEEYAERERRRGK